MVRSSHNNVNAVRFEHSTALTCCMLTCRQEFFTFDVKGKGKVHPRTAHEGPEGEQMYSSTLPSTSVLDGGGCSTTRPGRFTPGKAPVPGWAPRSVWIGAGNHSYTWIRSPDLPARSESYRLSYHKQWTVQTPSLFTSKIAFRLLAVVKTYVRSHFVVGET